SLAIIRCLEQDAVVLIGMKSLLASGFAAKAQPGERNPRSGVRLSTQLDHPAHRLVVQQSNDVGDLAGRRSVSKHTVDQAMDLPAPPDELSHIRAIAYRPRQMDKIHPLQGK